MNVDIVFRQTALQWDRMVSEQSANELDARFSALVERQSRLLFRIVYAVLRNPDDAEDVVQETFLKVLKNGTWLHMQDERAFLARVAWRIALNRRPARRAASQEQELPAGTPENDVIAAEETRRMHALIDAASGEAAAATDPVCAAGVEHGGGRRDVGAARRNDPAQDRGSSQLIEGKVGSE